jgi:hypothetical protein
METAITDNKSERAEGWMRDPVVKHERISFDGKPLVIKVRHSYFFHYHGMGSHDANDVNSAYGFAKQEAMDILRDFREEFDKEHKHSSGMIQMYAHTKSDGIKIGAKITLLREEGPWNRSKLRDYWTFERTKGSESNHTLIHKGTIDEEGILLIADDIKLRMQTKSLEEFLSRQAIQETLRTAETSGTRRKTGSIKSANTS